MAIHNMRHLEKTIVDALLALRDADEQNQYPHELYVPRRNAYLAQVETITEKRAAPVGKPGTAEQ